VGFIPWLCIACVLPDELFSGAYNLFPSFELIGVDKPKPPSNLEWSRNPAVPFELRDHPTSTDAVFHLCLCIHWMGGFMAQEMVITAFETGLMRDLFRPSFG
jgi:hypothetical protein